MMRDDTRIQHVVNYRTGKDALTPSEYLRILAACGTQQDKAWFVLAVATGIRRQDLFDITVGNVHLDKATLTYHEHKKDKRDPVTKEITEEMWRTIPLPPNAVQEIRILLDQTKRIKRKKRKDHLFTFKGRQAYNRFQTLCTAAGVTPRPFHALRATMVKRAIAAGWSWAQIAEITGDTIDVLQKFYAVPSDSEMAALVTEKPIV